MLPDPPPSLAWLLFSLACCLLFFFFFVFGTGPPSLNAVSHRLHERCSRPFRRDRSAAAMALRPSAVALEWFKRGARGLFGGKQTRTGNKVSHAENKSRRTWKPNVLEKRLYSETLDRTVRWKVTAAAWRTVKKKGGLDGYLLGSSDEAIRFPTAIAMKREIAAARAAAAAAGGGGVGLGALARDTGAAVAVPERTPPPTGRPGQSGP